MKCDVEPLNGRIAVWRSEEPNMTTGGLHIPDNAKERPSHGTVMAVGPGRVLDSGVRVEPTLVVGDRIVFGKYSGTEIEVSGQTLVLMREDEVLARYVNTASATAK